MRLSPLLIAGTLATAIALTGCGRVTPTQPALRAGARPASAVPGNAYQGGTGAGALLASGAGALSGRVIDQAKRTGVAGATVLIEQTGQRLTTDASGAFRAANVPAGSYTFKAMAPGLQQISTNGALVTANARAEVPEIVMMPGNGPTGITSVTFSAGTGFGHLGDAPAKLVAPLGLAVRGSDALVLDVNRMPGVKTGIVRQYDAASGKFAGKFGDYSKWLGMNQMRDTVKAIAADTQGRTLVLDGESKLWRFQTDGDKDRTVELGIENGNDLAVDPRLGAIYVAHAGGLTKLNAEAEMPTPLGTLGDCRAVAVASDGLWVLNDNLVKKLGPDGSVIYEFGAAGAGASGQAAAFSGASDLAVDARNGNLVVVDSGTKNVYVYDSAGTLVGKIGQGTFEKPVAVAIDGAGHAFVLDAAKKKVYRFQPLAVK